MNNFDITNKTVSAFTMYKFITDITKPYTQLEAFKNGFINEEGYFTGEEGQIPTFDLFVIYTKRLFDEIPNPSTKAKLSNFTSAMSLFKESLDEYDLDSDYIIDGIQQAVIEMNLFEQEASGVPANAIGDGFSNPQVGEGGNLAGYSPPLILMRRKKKKKESILDKIVFKKENSSD